MSGGLDGPRVTPPLSLAALATDAIRSMILSGELPTGTRIVETALAESLGVSRPPLREALKTLEHEGLVVAQPRRGAMVTPLTQHDVFEIVTLRDGLERLAVTLGVPVRVPQLLVACREAVQNLDAAARAGDEGDMTTQTFAFHLAVVGLAQNRRMEATYRSLSAQMQLCMALNRTVRRENESLAENAARHRALLDTIVAGDPEAVLAELSNHGHHSFVLRIADGLDGASPQSRDWIAELRSRRSR